MKKKFSKVLLVFSVLLMLLGITSLGQSSVSANSFDNHESAISEDITVNEELINDEGLITPFAEIGPTYPGTNFAMRVGDVLYSTKALGGSSAIVGHTGIVNSDFKVVHVTLPVNGGTIDNMTGYMYRHGEGETIKVYRPRNGMGVNAAKWATYNYSYVKEYLIQIASTLGSISPNYCSKFVWQAFYFGEGTDILNKNLNANTLGFVTPGNITDSPYLSYQISFQATR